MQRPPRRPCARRGACRSAWRRRRPSGVAAVDGGRLLRRETIHCLGRDDRAQARRVDLLAEVALAKGAAQPIHAVERLARVQREQRRVGRCIDGRSAANTLNEHVPHLQRRRRERDRLGSVGAHGLEPQRRELARALDLGPVAQLDLQEDARPERAVVGVVAAEHDGHEEAVLIGREFRASVECDRTRVRDRADNRRVQSRHSCSVTQRPSAWTSATVLTGCRSRSTEHALVNLDHMDLICEMRWRTAAASTVWTLSKSSWYRRQSSAYVSAIHHFFFVLALAPRLLRWRKKRINLPLSSRPCCSLSMRREPRRRARPPART